MRGITECLKYMINNPMMELHKVGDLSKRRYSTEESQFEYFNNIDKQWHLLYKYGAFSDGYWQPYDPNPSVDFLTAYGDCKLNGNKYKSVGYDSYMQNIQGHVHIENCSPFDECYKKGAKIYSVVFLNVDWKKAIS